LSVATPVLPVAAKGRGRRVRAALSVVTSSREGRIGVAIIAVFVIIAIFGPLLAPYSPTHIGAGNPNLGPSTAHPLGTDQLGRDVLSRLLCGAASVILIPLLATTLTFAIGGLAGIALGYCGGRVDAFGSRVIDILISLPPLLVVLVVIAALGSSTAVIVISAALVYSPRVARVLRGAAQGVATREYIQAAQARGEGAFRIVVREVMPNISPTLFVEYAVRLTYVIIFVTTLNFLGLGVQPPSPNWGRMLFDSRATIITDPIVTIAPTVAIALLAIGIGLVADAATQRFGLESSGELLR
jgi:peptide/nickel transport system permease protein